MNTDSRAAQTSSRRLGLVILDAGSAELRVAALSVLDRLLVALHRAGCDSLVVVVSGGRPLPPIPRATAWGIAYRVESVFPERTGPTLVVRSDTLVQVDDLRGLMTENVGTRLVSADGGELPVGWIGPGSGDPEAALAGLPVRRAQGVARRVRNRAEAKDATRALWASITSASDGVVDRWFNRPVGRPLSRWLVHTPVTPNAISIVSTLIGLLAAALFAAGRPGWSLVAAVVFQISAIVDCVDGDVARAVFKETPIGKWVDLVGDQVVHVAVFAGIAVGVASRGEFAWAGWLGWSAGVGAVLSFLAVLRGMRWVRSRGADAGRMQRILDAVTNRDFSVLVLGLALVDRLEWFLWLAGLGSHVFWMGLLVLQRGMTARRGEVG